MTYDWRFPDWKKSEQPTRSTRQVLDTVVQHLGAKKQLTRDDFEARIESVVGAIYGIEASSIVVCVVPVDDRLTIVEVRNNG